MTREKQPAIQICPGRDKGYFMRDMKRPEMFPGGVRLRVLRVGECPTAKAVTSGLYGAAPAGEDYLTLGHEILAETIDFDCRVPQQLHDKLKKGTKVMVAVRVPTPGATGLALTAPYLCSNPADGWVEHGLWGAHGGYTEEMVVDANWLYPITDDLTEPQAVLAEGAVCVHTAIQRGIRHQLATLNGIPWPYKSAALVLGAGPASVMATMFFRQMGYQVVVVSRGPCSDAKAKRVERMGASYLQSENHPGFIKDVVHRFGPFSQVFNGSGVAKARQWQLAVGDTGSFVEYSIPEAGCAEEVDRAVYMVKEVTCGTCSVGSINCDPKLWDRTFQALRRACVEWPWFTEGMFVEVPFDSKAPAEILKSVDEGWFKPMVVMPKA